MNENEKKFAALYGAVQMMESIYELKNTDYGKGWIAGVVTAVRAFGFETDFNNFVKGLLTKNADPGEGGEK